MSIIDKVFSFMSSNKEPKQLRNPFIGITYSYSPLRLKAYSNEKAILTIELVYSGEISAISSLEVNLQTGLSFDSTNINKKKIIRLGELNNNEKKSLELEIFSTVNTPKGSYKVELIANVHDKDYGQILRQFKKSFEIRVE
ncbi:MAG: hypothetical protein QXF76_01765 [Candidatus Anstonellales archaeon]